MNRRDFVTQLLSVPVGLVVAGKAIGHTQPESLMFEYIPPEPGPFFTEHATIREQARDNLARWYSSKIDTLVHRSLIHG